MWLFTVASHTHWVDFGNRLAVLVDGDLLLLLFYYAIKILLTIITQHVLKSWWTGSTKMPFCLCSLLYMINNCNVLLRNILLIWIRMSNILIISWRVYVEKLSSRLAITNIFPICNTCLVQLLWSPLDVHKKTASQLWILRQVMVIRCWKS